MNFVDENAGAQMLNVVSLFKREETLISDPLADLLNEGGDEVMVSHSAPELRSERRKLVREDHFPEQGLVILDQQLESLNEKLSRIKFYLSDLDDILPK